MNNFLYLQNFDLFFFFCWYHHCWHCKPGTSYILVKFVDDRRPLNIKLWSAVRNFWKIENIVKQLSKCWVPPINLDLFLFRFATISTTFWLYEDLWGEQIWYFFIFLSVKSISIKKIFFHVWGEIILNVCLCKLISSHSAYFWKFVLHILHRLKRFR